MLVQPEAHGAPPPISAPTHPAQGALAVLRARLFPPPPVSLTSPRRPYSCTCYSGSVSVASEQRALGRLMAPVTPGAGPALRPFASHVAGPPL